MNVKTTRVELFDGGVAPKVGERSITGLVQTSELGISIELEGHSDFCSEHYGALVYLELYDGELKVRVYSDINSEEPTHSISLEGARNERRKQE